MDRFCKYQMLSSPLREEAVKLLADGIPFEKHLWKVVKTASEVVVYAKIPIVYAISIYTTRWVLDPAEKLFSIAES
jgi:hypothetical protein